MDANQKQKRDECRGRSLKRDAENLKNKHRAFVPSPPPKAHSLGNRGPKAFCNFCSPRLAKRKLDAQINHHMALTQNDEPILYPY